MLIGNSCSNGPSRIPVEMFSPLSPFPPVSRFPIRSSEVNCFASKDTLQHRRPDMQSSFFKQGAFGLLLASIILPQTGCGKSVLPPPVDVGYRESLVGLGTVIQITNNSAHHLYNVRVVGRNYESFTSASVKVTEHLTPGETIEVGWLEFGSWVPVAGESIEVYCDEYVVPKASWISTNAHQT